MKTLPFLALACVLCGCKHSEFDVSSNQVAKKLSSGVGRPHGMPDLNHLPPGAVKHEVNFKKGDRLPDGSIATTDGKMVRVEMDGASGPGKPEGRVLMQMGPPPETQK